MKDIQVEEIIKNEEKRQAEGLELIPSENYVSAAVREALGSVMTNKYSEGYPGKRYYGGQKYTDEIETVAQQRAKKLFNCKYVNVQPLSGAPANLALYAALMEPGDTILGMDLSHGGHLTHGMDRTIAAKVFNFVRYKMKDIETGEIDYDELRAIALREKPKVILAGYSAYSRELDWAKFVEIAREVGAYAVADVAHIAGLIVGGAMTNPFDYGFDVMLTTTHKTLRGPRGGMILVREDEELAKKIDKEVFPGLQGGPHMNNIAAKAVAFKEALDPTFAHYATQIIENAAAMVDVFTEAEIRLITGGTSNHLILADVYSSLGMSGKEAEELLDAAGLTVNKNVIADDTRKPLDPSGIRFGTPALTTRGFDANDCRRIAEIMVAVLKKEMTPVDARKKVTTLALGRPIPDSFI